MTFGMGLAGFLLSLISAEWFVRISRYEVSSLPAEKRRIPLRTLTTTVPLMLMSFGALIVSALPFPRERHVIEVLFPAVALAGWCACWARGLERYIDKCYPDRTLSTYSIQQVSLAPIGVILLGIHGYFRLNTALEVVLLSAALLPIYLLFSVFLVRRAYPGIVLKRVVLQSMALRFALGFVVVGLAAGLLWTCIPFLRQMEYMQLFWWFLPYLTGSSLERAFASRLTRNTALTESQPASPSVIPPVSETTEEKQALTIGH